MTTREQAAPSAPIHAAEVRAPGKAGMLAWFDGLGLPVPTTIVLEHGRPVAEQLGSSPSVVVTAIPLPVT